ncbi:MAG: adenylate cyclase [Peptococcaceae bacterium]|nr:adenylate cyclase [Peptococcaceae bacterium]
MSYNINSTEDVYKYAQVLYDYLQVNGQHQLAESLGNLVDGCFSSSEAAIKAHHKALNDVKNSEVKLPPEHHHALVKSLELLA